MEMKNTSYSNGGGILRFTPHTHFHLKRYFFVWNLTLILTNWLLHSYIRIQHKSWTLYGLQQDQFFIIYHSALTDAGQTGYWNLDFIFETST